jgi:hypothetical protein
MSCVSLAAKALAILWRRQNTQENVTVTTVFGMEVALLRMGMLGVQWSVLYSVLFSIYNSNLVSRLVMATHRKSGMTSPPPIIGSSLLTTSLAAARID